MAVNLTPTTLDFIILAIPFIVAPFILRRKHRNNNSDPAIIRKTAEIDTTEEKQLKTSVKMEQGKETSSKS